MKSFRKVIIRGIMDSKIESDKITTKPFSVPAVLYKTVRPKAIWLGKIKLQVEPDMLAKRLYVRIHECKELISVLSESYETDFHIRILIERSTEPLSSLNYTLFAQHLSTIPNYCKVSAFHRAALSPVIDEEFNLDVTDCWLNAEEYRLYIAVMCRTIISESDAGCIGCMSLKLDRLIQGSLAETPKWYWLLPKTQGIQQTLPVKVQCTSEPNVSQDAVVLAGRASDKSYSKINGIYEKRDEVCNGKFVFKHSTEGFYLWFHDQRKAWVISDFVGYPVPYAYVEDSADHPGNIENLWFVFSSEPIRQDIQYEEKQETKKRHPIKTSKHTDGPRFEYDMMLRCHNLTPVL